MVMLADDLPREAVQALRANRLRSFLTLLGIIIGVATLVGVVSVISGLNGWVQEKVITLSPDVYVVTKFGVIRSRDEFLDALKRPDIRYEDYRLLSGVLRKAEQVAADVNTNAAVKFRDKRLPDVRVHGTTANYGAMMNLDLAAEGTSSR
jgi:putative ABC transport system permease protein